MKNWAIYILLLLLATVPIGVRANMAQPYFDGDLNAAMYGNKAYSVVHEIIDIEIHKDSLYQNLYAIFKIHYKIYSPNKADLPLLFLAFQIQDYPKISVNGRGVSDQPLHAKNVKQFPFISETKENGKTPTYSVSYAKNQYVPVDLDNLIYFTAPLNIGENDLYVAYRAHFGFDTYGFLRNYTLKYSLYPSQFWKSSGPIQVNLHLNELAEITRSNLGKANIENGIAKWRLDSTDKDIDIVINHKTSWFSKVLLFIDPAGIGILTFIALVLLHCRFFKSMPKYRNWIYWLGIILLPALAFSLSMFSFDFVDWVLGYHSRHGYVLLLYIFLYPFSVLIYAVLLSFWLRKRLPKKSNLS